MPAATDKPSPADLLSRASAAAVAGVNVQLPATIVSYDADEQRATIQLVPSFRRTVRGSVTLYRPPPIPNVPVAFMGGGGGDYSDTWPLQAGDMGLAMFCDRSIDEWLSTGASGTEPQSDRRHDITDAVFLPAARPFADPVPAAGLDASARVIRAPLLKLGSSAASDFVALASLVQQEIQALWTALQTHTHGGVTTGAGFSATTIYPGAAGSVACTKVKAE